MDQRRGRANPFYVLLVAAGTAFALTACAYGVMAVKELHASQANWSRTEIQVDDNRPTQDARFIAFMDQHGVRLMLIELAVLGVSTALAMGTDRWWSGAD